MSPAPLPQPTPTELAIWRALADAILSATTAPAPKLPARLKALRAARKKAVGRVVPGGNPHRLHPFCRLSLEGAAWLDLPAPERAAQSAELEAVARACLARLDAADGAGADRADLNGYVRERGE